MEINLKMKIYNIMIRVKFLSAEIISEIWQWENTFGENI